MVHTTAHRWLKMPIIISVIGIQIWMTTVVKFMPWVPGFSLARSLKRPFSLALLFHQHRRAPVPLRVHSLVPAVEILKRRDWVKPVRVAAPVLTRGEMIHRQVQLPRRGLGNVCGLRLLVAVQAVLVHSTAV